MTNGQLEKLYGVLEDSLDFSPSVDDCSDQENQMYSDMAALKDSMFDLGYGEHIRIGDKIMNQEKFYKACNCLVDNGIEIDEAETVLQALVYIICDEETEEFFDAVDTVCLNCTGIMDDCEQCKVRETCLAMSTKE